MDFSQVSKIRLEGKPYDAEVEYLENASGGGQYIDTGVLLTDDSTFEVVYQPLEFPTDSNGAYVVCGSRSDVSNVQRIIALHSAHDGQNYTCIQKGGFDTNWRVLYESGFVTVRIGPTLGAINLYEFNLPSVQSSNTPMYLFGQYADIDPSLFAAKYRLRVSSFKMWQGSNLVRDFIPVRKNGVGCFYDKVSGQLFGNQGTGAFLYGSDVRCYSVAKIERGSTTLWKKRPYDAEVEWLESTANGGQYINTQHVFQFGDVVETAFQATATPTQTFYPFGSDTGYNKGINIHFDPTSIQTMRAVYGTVSSPDFNVEPAIPFSTATRYVCRLSSSGCSINNSTCVAGTNEHLNSNPILLFGEYRNAEVRTTGNSGFIIPVKIFYFKISRAGVLLHDFQPVRVGTTGCLYDKVSGELFGNAGTGSFGYGADLEGSNS